jgi:lipopolysaccharide transport system ATP-binding protein
MSSEHAAPVDSAADAEPVIEAQDLSKAYAIFKRPEDRLKQMLFRGRRRFYDEYWALRNVSLSVRRGETVGVIGRNGSGKSTFLQMVCGTLQPTSGRISVRGRIAALLELGAGFNPEFTGKENVYLAASILGLPSREIDRRYADIVDFAGIGDFIEHPVKLYSSGMYARLAFAVAAHVDADVLIVDEILSVGDAAFTQKCMRFIRRFREKGTLFFVSHDTGQVVNLCDRVIWLDRGEVREIGPAKEVCRRYLADLYGSREHAEGFHIGGERRSEQERAAQDVRAEMLRASERRNEIEVFTFDNEAAPWFGERGGSILRAEIQTPAGEPLSALEGGEEVVLKVFCRAERELHQPIVGFYVKDRLGQNLFGDNTYLTYRLEPLSVAGGAEFAARFHFRLPYLPSGDFAVTVALAEGTQNDHVQHHWIDEALFFKVHASHVVRGLVGIPMLDIAIEHDGAL